MLDGKLGYKLLTIFPIPNIGYGTFLLKIVIV
nr:MAG TPA: hypothetical protein [Caudoviricetes sp.]